MADAALFPQWGRAARLRGQRCVASAGTEPGATCHQRTRSTRARMAAASSLARRARSDLPSSSQNSAIWS
jgi:hypothetical protein